ncbi:inositol polyphosphate 5-phosphatase [Tetrabaena socialis]|uniref:Inositol polyphosphate 5-phosphatase n=1 Tax=Tetrabaena socialis TaxID=47790 RepID=A0A2J8AB95_9CHLO|nr:inositol polyphosphate 5-phosphatase [Tetrabaena socialis]|eukprot:PNH09800.1 inositol polyphosphate 5-phosphatase [Tetrabaena socialis]
MPIKFAPTFKYTQGTDAFDLRRTPAWTDRVLFLANADPLFADLKPLYYMSVPELRTSDHKPVIAGFELSISPQHANAGRHAKSKGCVIS